MIDLFNQTSLLALIILPLLGVVLLMLIPSGYKDVIRYSALAISTIVSLIALFVYLCKGFSRPGRYNALLYSLVSF